MIIQTITYMLFGRSGLTPGLALARYKASRRAGGLCGVRRCTFIIGGMWSSIRCGRGLCSLDGLSMLKQWRGA